MKALAAVLKDVCSLVGATKSEFGGVDILVNNAGIVAEGSLEEITPEIWGEVVNTNLTGAFYCSRAVVPVMREQEGGDIINISSRAGINAYEGGFAYNASKFGLNGLSEALFLELKKYGIRVSYMMPGRVSTNFGDEEPEPWHVGPEDVAELVLSALSLNTRSVASRIEIRPVRTPY